MGKAVPPAGGADEERPLNRGQEARLDAALAEYRDHTFAHWSAPDGFTAHSPLGDRRIAAAIRAAVPDAGVLLAAATPGGDRGPFADGTALSRCLDAASIPARQRTLLGAGPLRLRGDHATVLLLPGGRLGDVRLLAVTPSCAQGESSSVLVDRVLTGGAGARTATP